MSRLRPALAGVAGAASVLAYAPFELFPVAAVALAILYALLCRAADAAATPGARRRAGFLIGWAWGFGALLAGVSWLYVALHRFGGMPAPLAGSAVILFCALMALFAGLAGGLFATLRRDRPWADAALFGALWLLTEWTRGWLFTGFPWLASGYSQTPPSPLAGFAPVFGVFGVGGLLAWTAALLAEALQRRRIACAGVAVLVAAGGAALRPVAWTAPVGEPLQVALLQPNMEQDLKWRPDMLPRWLDIHLDLLRSHPATLVVLPETTLPLLLEHLPDGYLDALTRAAAVGGDAILGAFVRDGEGRVFNAALSVGRSPTQHYAKHHLVPFGEYSPPLFRWFYDVVHIPMADQTRGAEKQPPMALAGQKIAVNICYEDVFGEELIRALPEATLMLNLSNLAWYGDSFAQPQHLQIARLRALESGRPMLRATNTGMTGLVLPDGTVSAVLPAFTRGALPVTVRGYTGTTPYVRWGNVPAVALAAAVVALALLRRARGRTPI